MSNRVKLLELADKNFINVAKGKNLPKDYRDKGDYPVIAAGKSIAYFSSHPNYNNNTITISSSGANAGFVWKHTYPIWASDCTVIEVNEDIDFNYLYLFFLSKQRIIYSFQEGAGQPHVYWKDIKNIEINLPTLEKQKQIAKTLDKANELVELRKESITKLDALAKSIFIDMFGDPVSNPKKWEIKKLKEILKNIDSGWSPICNNYPSRNNNFGILKLSSLSNDVYNDNENKEMIDGVDPKIEALILNGDLLFSRKNTYMLVGSCAYVFNTKDNLFMPDLIFRLNTNSEVEKIFLWKYMVNEKNKIRLRNIANGAAASMPNISKAKLMDFEIYLPPLDLQNKFAKIIEKIEEQKTLYTQELEKLQNNFDALLQKSFQE
jgi:type I restriction enzyme, S subunit